MKKTQLIFSLIKIDFIFIMILFAITFMTIIFGINSDVYGRLGLAILGFLFILLLLAWFLSIIINFILVYYVETYIAEIKTTIFFAFINYYNLLILSDKIRPQEISIFYFIPLYVTSILLVYFYFFRSIRVFGTRP